MVERRLALIAGVTLVSQCTLQGYLNPLFWWIFFGIGVFVLVHFHRRLSSLTDCRNVLLFSYMFSYNLPLLLSYLYFHGPLGATGWLFVTLLFTNWICLGWTHLASPGYISARARDTKDILMCAKQKHPIDWNSVCRTCFVLKPLRSKHCSVRNVCVPKFDHYCVWTVNTIGRDNYPQFFTFVNCLMLSFLIHIVVSIKYMIVHSPEGASTFDIVWKLHPGLFNFTTAHFVLCLYLIVLCGQHWYLAAKNITTNEMINKSRYAHFWTSGTFKNPFSRGFLKNIVEVFRPQKDLLYDGSVVNFSATQATGGGDSSNEQWNGASYPKSLLIPQLRSNLLSRGPMSHSPHQSFSSQNGGLTHEGSSAGASTTTHSTSSGPTLNEPVRSGGSLFVTSNGSTDGTAVRPAPRGTFRSKKKSSGSTGSNLRGTANGLTPPHSSDTASHSFSSSLTAPSGATAPGSTTNGAGLYTNLPPEFLAKITSGLSSTPAAAPSSSSSSSTLGLKTD